MILDAQKRNTSLIIIASIILAIALRMVFLPFETPDLTLIVFKWYDTLLKDGRIDALRTNFYNYTPAYIYLIDIMTLFMWIPKLIAIKSISILFDFFAAIAVYKLIGIIVQRKVFQWIGFFSVLFLPTVFVESSLWGQVDIIYTAFLLWALYFILKNQSGIAMVSFSIALCFKFQAMFFLPVFFILYLHKKIKFYWFFLIPIIYIISVLPCWILGRSIYDLLTIYLQQAVTYKALSMRAANLYIFIDSKSNFEMKVYIGIGITAIISLSYVLLRWLKWKRLDFYAICFDAAFFTTILPFILPKMHERYFFAGCIFLLILTFHDRKNIPATILCQASSMLAYIPYLSGWTNNWVKIATVINTIGIFIFLYYGNKVINTDNVIKNNFSNELI